MNLEKIVEGVKKHLSDSTAINVVYTPIYALMETGIANMSAELSTNARLLGAGVVYGGIGYLIGKGRDISKKAFSIDENSSKLKRSMHDILYVASTALVINPGFYLAAGSRNINEIAIGTLAGAGIGAVTGAPMGYAMDCFRDLFGIEKSDTLPKKISNASSKTKKLLATGLITASIGSSGIIINTLADKQEALPIEVVAPNYKEINQ